MRLPIRRVANTELGASIGIYWVCDIGYACGLGATRWDAFRDCLGVLVKVFAIKYLNPRGEQE